MKIFYSPSAPGFFFDSVHENMPDDAHEISEEKYQAMLAEQSATGEMTE